MLLIIYLAATVEIKPFFYTNYNCWYDLCGRSDTIFGATNGGLVCYDAVHGRFRVLTDADGLPMNRLNCVALDSSGYIWTGSEDGIALTDPSFQTVRIYPVDCLPCRRIYASACQRDTVFFGTADGLLRIETMGTPDQFDDDLQTAFYDINGLPSSQITALAAGRDLWVGTPAGLARCSRDFLQIDVFTTSQGLLDNHVTCLLCDDTLILAGTKRGLNRFHAGRFDTLWPGRTVKAIARSGDTIMLALDSLPQVGVLTADTQYYLTAGLPSATPVNRVAKTGSYWFAGLGNAYGSSLFGDGLGQCDLNTVNPVWSVQTAACLPSNHISDICVSAAGVFLAHGVRTNGALSRGIGWLRNDSTWTHFALDTIIPSGLNVHRCETAPDGKIWFTMNTVSFAAADSFIAFAYQPGTGQWFFTRKPENTDAIWDIKFDAQNNLYVQIGRSQLPGGGNRTWVIDRNLTARAYLPPQKEGFFDEITISASGQVWKTIAYETGSGAEGLVMTDTRGTPYDNTDDLFRIYTVDDGLPSNKVRGCVLDQQQIIYVATNRGLAEGDSGRFSTIPHFYDQDLIDVTLDTENRIWILGYQGISNYDPGFQTATDWTFGSLDINLELISDPKEVIQVQGFIFDPYRHCLWLAGDNGLLRLDITSSFSPDLNRVVVYPNPLVNGRTIRIKNLPADSRVSIFSLAGRCLSKELKPDPTFGEIVWNVPENTPSGLYFALVVTAQGKRLAKFAIAR